MLISTCQRLVALSGGRLDIDDPAPAAPTPAPAALLQSPLPHAAAAGPFSADAVGGAPPDEGAGAGLRRGNSLAAAFTSAGLRAVVAAPEVDRSPTAMAVLGDGEDNAAAERGSGQGHMVAESWIQRRVSRLSAHGELVMNLSAIGTNNTECHMPKCGALVMGFASKGVILFVQLPPWFNYALFMLFCPVC
jgi:hypothetical protein